MLTRTDRLRRRQEFVRAQARGRRRHTTHFGVCLAPSASGSPRLGIIVGRKLGKAVRRNRIKRLVREFFRRHKGLLPSGDIIIMAKRGAAELHYSQVSEELRRVLVRAVSRGPDED